MKEFIIWAIITIPVCGLMASAGADTPLIVLGGMACGVVSYVVSKCI